MPDINNNKKLYSVKMWKYVNPVFGNKVKGNKTVTLVEGNAVIINDEERARQARMSFGLTLTIV